MILIWGALGAHWNHRGRTSQSFLYRAGRGHEALDLGSKVENNTREC